MRARNIWKKAALKVSNRALRHHQRVNAWLKSFDGSEQRAPYLLRNNPSTADRRVVHFNGNFSVGGSTQLIVDLIELMSDSYRQEVIVPFLPPRLPYQPVDVRAFDTTQLEEVRSLLKGHRPDLVHIHYWSRAENRFDATGVWYASVLAICAELDLPVIQNVNVPTKPMRGDPIRCNVFVSEFVRSNFDEGAVPSEVIYPGSDFTHFEQTEDRGFLDTIGMVYRLDNDKLSARSIEPFILVARARTTTRSIIVGEGGLSNYFRHRVEQEGLGDRIHFVGMVSYADLPKWYERMNLFVAPVHNESFGQVSPFAMSMGLPIAGYDVGALPEILGSNDTLVDVGDEKALANLILELLSAPDQLSRLGAANRQRAHALFSRPAMIDRYRRLYSEVLARRVPLA